MATTNILNTIPTKDQVDAVHVPVIAGQLQGDNMRFWPGEAVHVEEGKVYKLPATVGQGNGVINPWTSHSKWSGSYVHVLMNPELVESLVHTITFKDNVLNNIQEDEGFDPCEGCY